MLLVEPVQDGGGGAVRIRVLCNIKLSNVRSSLSNLVDGIYYNPLSASAKKNPTWDKFYPVKMKTNGAMTRNKNKNKHRYTWHT